MMEGENEEKNLEGLVPILRETSSDSFDLGDREKYLLSSLFYMTDPERMDLAMLWN